MDVYAIEAYVRRGIGKSNGIAIGSRERRGSISLEEAMGDGFMYYLVRMGGRRMSWVGN